MQMYNLGEVLKSKYITGEPFCLLAAKYSESEVSIVIRNE